MLLVLLTTFVSFSTLYASQPLLPLLAEEFAISVQQASLITTITLVPLAVAPLVYGYLLQAIPARNILLVSVLLLGLNQIAFFWVTQYWQFLTLRFLQGLLLPAVFTSLMTYTANVAANDRIKQAMGSYVAITIVGGCLSRIAGGYIAVTVGWQWVFVSLGGLLVLLVPLIWSMAADAKVDFTRLDIRAMQRVWQSPLLKRCYLTLFLVFFVFAGVLNMLPFRVQTIYPEIGSGSLSILYFGYLVGIPAALLSTQIAKALGGETKTIVLAILMIIFGLFLFLCKQYVILLGMMFLLAGAMFYIHSSLSGLVNHHATEHKGIVNGLYVAIYYLSGALGSWMPALVFSHWPWWVIIVFGQSILIAALVVIFLFRENKSH